MKRLGPNPRKKHSQPTNETHILIRHRTKFSKRPKDFNSNSNSIVHLRPINETQTLNKLIS